MAFDAAIVYVGDAFLRMFADRLTLVVTIVASPIRSFAWVANGALPAGAFVIHREGMPIDMDVAPASSIVAL
jgi:hypothetical protein